MKAQLTIGAVLITGLHFCIPMLTRAQLSPEADHPSETYCGSMDALHRAIQEDPTVGGRFQELLREVPAETSRGGGTILIPVAVHLVYNNAQQNISDAQVQSAVDVLNEDFRRQNADAINTADYSAYGIYPADAGINFCLHHVSRTYSQNPSFAIDPAAAGGIGDVELVKSIAPSSGQGFLNVWVCDLQGNMAGIATFPNTTAPAFDGITVDYQYMGRTGGALTEYQGRTITHETGHWFGLFHIWGNFEGYEPNGFGYFCGDDLVADTWPQNTPNTGLCPWQLTGCYNYGPGYYYPYPPMNQNYMDYTQGQCQNFFSMGQADRMWSIIGTYRPYLVNAPLACDVSIGEPHIAGLPIVITHVAGESEMRINTQVHTGPLHVRIIDAIGRTVQVAINRTTGTVSTIEISSLAAGTYTVVAEADERSGMLRFVVP